MPLAHLQAYHDCVLCTRTCFTLGTVNTLDDFIALESAIIQEEEEAEASQRSSMETALTANANGHRAAGADVTGSDDARATTHDDERGDAAATAAAATGTGNPASSAGAPITAADAGSPAGQAARGSAGNEPVEVVTDAGIVITRTVRVPPNCAIGMALATDYDGGHVVQQVLPDTPAFTAGVMVEEVLVGINQPV